MAREPAFEQKEKLIRKEICHESDENSHDNEHFNNVSNKKSNAKKSQIKLKKFSTAATDTSISVNQRSKAIKKSNTSVVQVKKISPQSHNGGLKVIQEVVNDQLC